MTTKVYLNKSNKRSGLEIIIALIQLAAVPVTVMFCFEYPQNPAFLTLPYIRLILNFIIASVISALFITIIPGIYPGIYLVIVAACVLGVGNAEVVVLRSYPIAPVDIISIRTARAVASGYNISLSKEMWLTIFIATGVILLIKFLRRKRLGFFRLEKRVRQASFLGGILLALISVIAISDVDFAEKYSLSSYAWDPALSYRENGFELSMVVETHNMMIKRPDGYSKKKAKKYLKDKDNNLETVKTDFSGFKNKNPLVITIMNESFTDFDAVCDFPDSEKYLDYYYSLKDDPGTVEWGYAYVSTRGGGTCKSEFEELTGNTMYYLKGTNPYMMYSFEKVPTWVGYLKKRDYSAIAMHPFFPTNWKRDMVYGDMGFDDFITDGYDTSLYDERGYETDKGDYLKVLEEARAHPEKTFFMNVTLQNHGGYDPEVFPGYIRKLQKPFDKRKDMSVFTGMMDASDDALMMLLESLKELDRPVELVFFGDHQPGLSKKTEARLEKYGKKRAKSDEEYEQSLYVTPYFIWTNYKVPKKYKPALYDGRNIISLNYLGAAATYYLGEKPDNYMEFLLNMRKKLPVININGFYSDELGFVSGDEKEKLSADEQELLKEYECVQYYHIFDNMGLK